MAQLIKLFKAFIYKLCSFGPIWITLLREITYSFQNYLNEYIVFFFPVHR